MVIGEKMIAATNQGKQIVPMVSIVGNSGSGKTSLLERVIGELKCRGYRVAVIKHSSHSFDIDIPGKDTWRLAKAGSDVVVISSSRKMAVIENVDKEKSLSQIKDMVKDKVDIVLNEGYLGSNAAKILILNGDGDKPPAGLKDEPLAVITVPPSPDGFMQFDDEDIDRLINLLIERMDSYRLLEDNSIVANLPADSDTYQKKRLERLLEEAALLHGHICAGQILGVRMAMRGLQELGIKNPKEEKKRLVVYVEIDRCATDAIQIVTGCKLGKRTMKYVDYGKLAATFVDLHTGNAVRVSVREDARDRASFYHPELTRYEAQLVAYRVMKDEEIFYVEGVAVDIPVHDMPGPPLRRVTCESCGEGVNDNREVSVAGRVLCRACAYGSYYEPQNRLAGEGVTVPEVIGFEPHL